MKSRRRFMERRKTNSSWLSSLKNRLLVLVFSAALITVSQSLEAQTAATAPVPAASGPAVPASSGLAGGVPAATAQLTFGPTYLPGKVELTSEQVDTIRSQVAAQMAAFYSARTEINLVNKDRYRAEGIDATRSFEFNQWARLHTEQVLTTHHFYSQVIFWGVILLVISALALTIYQFRKDSALSAHAARMLLGYSQDYPTRQAEQTPETNRNVPSVQPAAQASPDNPGSNMPSASSQPTTSGVIPSPTLPVSPVISVEDLRLVFKEMRGGPNNFTLGPNGVQIGTQLVGLAVLGFALAFFYLYLVHVYPVTIAGAPTAAASAPNPASTPPKPPEPVR